MTIPAKDLRPFPMAIAAPFFTGILIHSFSSRCAR